MAEFPHKVQLLHDSCTLGFVDLRFLLNDTVAAEGMQIIMSTAEESKYVTQILHLHKVFRQGEYCRYLYFTYNGIKASQGRLGQQ